MAMAYDLTINDLPRVVAALHRRRQVRWQEAGRVLPDQALHRLDGVTPALLLPGVIRARLLGFHELAPNARFDRDPDALVGVRMTPRQGATQRPLDGLVMTLVASEGLDQALDGLRVLRDTAAPGDSLTRAIEDYDGVTVGDLTALGTLIRQSFGESLSTDLANGPGTQQPKADDPPTRRPGLGL